MGNLILFSASPPLWRLYNCSFIRPLDITFHSLSQKVVHLLLYGDFFSRLGLLCAHQQRKKLPPRSVGARAHLLLIKCRNSDPDFYRPFIVRAPNINNKCASCEFKPLHNLQDHAGLLYAAFMVPFFRS